MYGVSVEDLQATNPKIQPRRMQIGQRVVVPKAPSVRNRLQSSGSGVAVGSGDRIVNYKVRFGDTLSEIANRHRVGLNDLLRWNSLSRTSVLHPGDELKIFLPAR
jgi:membrane-bound lytic murein transglycosylase D